MRIVRRFDTPEGNFAPCAPDDEFLKTFYRLLLYDPPCCGKDSGENTIQLTVAPIDNGPPTVIQPWDSTCALSPRLQS